MSTPGTPGAAGTGGVPDRDRWPEPPGHSRAGTAVTELIIATFRLNGLLLESAQTLAARGGLTAAWWQVLGGVLDEPRTVAEIGRRMGLSRQAVQRVADVLAGRGLAEYRDNPAHRRARLLACTEAGYWAVRQITLAQHPWTNALGASVDLETLRAAVATLDRMADLVEQNPPDSSSKPDAGQ
ncbi:DNA-binding MarR family transcriptional regulator [Friedmanniella endophytica]|uniref:DNA-binding MarR family transcriptional regulator n=1 Tax=Microlunatus kandeliicorticis TaxID=1759536 RepID=A0A7W3IQI6_9ACTN|nr:MarR family transcriptional regulator [Microlunatus kandeliicorticis]MBA8793388.1 DNA-binding MarR family transcriptional regulator [Microlunatus kandeliicorticis]